MPAKRKKERIVGSYFEWLLGQRDGVYYADGRSNRPSAGRHSLGTRSRADALAALKHLDSVRAVKVGLADKALLHSGATKLLTLAEGRKLYLDHVARPRIVGGARPTSAKRYRAVFDKFEEFAAGRGLGTWNAVNQETLTAYAAHLEDEGYAFATVYLELVTLKQAVKWLAGNDHLPPDSVIRLQVNKPQGTTTYCWRPEEVRAMVRHCRRHSELDWLADALIALACTGLRISELASLRWTDVSLETNTIALTDETTRVKGSSDRPARQTKSGRDRSFPIHPQLQGVLRSRAAASDSLVFKGPRGGRLKPDTVRQILIRDVLTPLRDQFPAATGSVGFADGRLHSFRHFFCSECANRRVPEQVVMEWLGHRDSAMVRHYYHLHDDEAQRQMRRLDFLDEAGNSGVAGEVS